MRSPLGMTNGTKNKKVVSNDGVFTRIFSQLSNGSFFFFGGEVMFGFNRLSHMFMVRKYDELRKTFSWVVTPTPRDVCDGEKDPTRYSIQYGYEGKAG